eukprot:Em0001g2671a
MFTASSKQAHHHTSRHYSSEPPTRAGSQAVVESTLPRPGHVLHQWPRDLHKLTPLYEQQAHTTLRTASSHHSTTSELTSLYDQRAHTILRLANSHHSTNNEHTPLYKQRAHTTYDQLEPPPSFDFRKPDEWPRWFRRFDQFRVASGLAADSEEKQVSTLLYCLGEEAEEVLAVSDTKPKKTYKAVVDTFNSFFGVRRNIIYERARSNTRVQQEGESAEQYVIALHSLAENCEYGTLKEDLIRDRLSFWQKTPSFLLEYILAVEKTLSAGAVEAGIDRNSRNSGLSINFGGSRFAVKALTSSSLALQKTISRQHWIWLEALSRRLQMDPELTLGKATRMVRQEEAVKEQQVALKQDKDANKLAGDVETTTTKENVLLTEQHVTVVVKEDISSLNVLQKGEHLIKMQMRERLNRLRLLSLEVLVEEKVLRITYLVFQQLRHWVLWYGLTRFYKSKIVAKYQSLFQGLGTMGEPYKILLTPEAKPVSLFAPRRVPIPLREQVLKELNRMESLGIISKVDTPTPWCAGMVVVSKPNGTIRICVDLKPLNECVLREIYPLPKVDDILAQLTGATVFSKLDANCGFWQIPLEPSSRLLTTFVSPFGRFCFNKLPFGISSAPELFQKRMNEILAGCTGTLCLIDDVQVFGATQEEHDLRLGGVLARIQAAGVTLNDKKCVFSTTTVKFLGHIVDKFGIRADPEKTMAINKMAQPTNVTELSRFMGMINQLGKFSPNLASITQPLRELMSSKSAWIWGPAQEQSFQASKDEHSKPTVLALYNPESKTKLSADASSYGLGAVLLQEHDHEWKPVVYASRSLTETESRYAQIEKEALSITWGCEKFSDYILGKNILIETDHKPLVPLLSSNI